MINLFRIGRVFYGLTMAAMGLLTVYYRDFPYMLLPAKHPWISDHLLLIYISGAFLFLAGACIVVEKKVQPVSLILGTVLLLIFCFYFIPYEFLVSANYMHFGDWENAAKELALAAGAFVVAGGNSRRLGVVLFGLTILSFGIDHYLYAKEAVGYMPSWVSAPIFWLYLTGTALLGSSIAIILAIRRGLFATLLGIMIFIWVLIVHFPKVIAYTTTKDGGELVSGFLALGYCGIAFAIAGSSQVVAEKKVVPAL